MNEPTAIPDEIAAIGLFEVMTAQAWTVLSAMAAAADPNTRELTLPVDRIAGRAGNSLFLDQVSGIIHFLSESGIVEKVSEDDPPTWRIPDCQRLVEARGKIDARVAAGEQPFPYVAPSRPNFRQR